MSYQPHQTRATTPPWAMAARPTFTARDRQARLSVFAPRGMHYLLEQPPVQRSFLFPLVLPLSLVRRAHPLCELSEGVSRLGPPIRRARGVEGAISAALPPPRMLQPARRLTSGAERATCSAFLWNDMTAARAVADAQHVVLE